MAILVNDKYGLVSINDLLGKEVCLFRHAVKLAKETVRTPGSPILVQTDYSVPAEKIKGILVGLHYNNYALKLTATLETKEGKVTEEVCIFDKYANNHGTWTPVTKRIFGKEVELQFIDENTYLIKE